MTMRRIYQLQCDECGATQRVDGVHGHDSKDQTWRAAANEGWSKNLINFHYCPQCTRNRVI